MKKKLVFYFYLNNDLIDSELYRVHLYCLNKYAYIFDEILFVISIDNDDDVNIAKEFEKRLISLHTKGTISFEIHINDKYRENYAFKKYVSDALSENKLIFFGHGKGVTNISGHDKNLIYKWIAGLYYFSLCSIKEVEYALLEKKYMSYGSFLTKNENNWTNKYRWFYIGTFFWVNSGKLLNYINENGITMPLLCDRFYDEEFLGNIYDCWPELKAYSYLGRYLLNAEDFYNHFDDYLHLLYGNENEEMNNFELFYSDLINSIKI